jgi:predicted MFS family arabinose efflux permease
MKTGSEQYKWYVLVLVVLTNILVVAMPMMGMSVLADEISNSLNLSLVQIGIVWGAGSLLGIVTTLLGGAIGDKLGPKRILVTGSLLLGLVGAARGLAFDFLSLAALAMLYGAIFPFVTMNGIKTAGQLFPPRQLGLANGLISMGMALGFFLGALLSASVFSPLLGGWRNVLIAYGVIGVLMAIPWALTEFSPPPQHSSGEQISIRSSIQHVARQRDIWLLGLTLFGMSGCFQGLLGYLPLYLRGQGWQPLLADGALSAFHLSSMLFVVPIAMWSDRLRSRKQLLLLASLLVALGAGLLSVAKGEWVWGAVLMAGFVRDAFMAIYLTMVVEVKGVGRQYAGTAVGFAMAISGIGTFLAPPLGNNLATWWPGAPFLFWSGLALLGMYCLAQVRERENQ